METTAAAGSTAAFATTEGQLADTHVTNLSAYHDYAAFDPVPAGQFTKVRKLAAAIHGKVILYRWEHDQAGQIPVVVKQMPTKLVKQNTNRQVVDVLAHRFPSGDPLAPHPEDALTEIGVISYLKDQADQPRYLLRMLASFEDGAGTTWLVTEFADGGEFFAHVAAGTLSLTEDKNRRYLWQLLQAVRYLHSKGIGHRDISLENILMSNGEFRLMDFGAAVQTHAPGGSLQRYMHYYRPAGKTYYRAPECLIPQAPQVNVRTPAVAKPGDVVMAKLEVPNKGYFCEVRLPSCVELVPGQLSTAEPWGYTVPAVDTFACGVCLFIMSWSIPPWGAALLADNLFNFICSRGDSGIADLLRHWKKDLLSPDAMQILTRMLQVDPSLRPSIDDCVAMPFFNALVGETVPVHAAFNGTAKPADGAPASSSGVPVVTGYPPSSSAAGHYAPA